MFGHFETDLGKVQISPNIVRAIILHEIENSHCFILQGEKPGDPASRKVSERCIRVNFSEGTVSITLVLSVHYGTRIIKEARKLQGDVAKTLKLRAGLNVEVVSINVESVFERPAQDQPLLIEQETESIRPDAVNQ